MKNQIQWSRILGNILEITDTTLGDGYWKALRGGSWAFKAPEIRAGLREIASGFESRSVPTGFRLVRTEK